MSRPGEKELKLAITLTLAFFFVEVAGGVISGSLSLLGDALHMFRDVASLLISLAAVKISRKPPSGLKTFGYHRYEILAAFLNGLMLIGVSFWIFYEGIRRLKNPPEIKGSIMLAVAAVGLLVNIIAALILHGSEDINIKSAFLHVLTDTLSSAAVILGGVVITLTGARWVDPALAFTISLFILISSFGILKEALRILLEFAPSDIKPEEVLRDISSVDGVKDAHHLHIWSLCSNITALEVHILTDAKNIEELERIKSRVKEMLREKYGINHTTLELEWERCQQDCLGEENKEGK